MYWFVIYFLCIVQLCTSVDYYDLLGVPKDAENREIRRAFKKLALKYHPDKNQGEEDAHEKFIAINKAYEVLKDEEMRKKYDLHGEEGLKEDFGQSWKGNYRSWSYYSESFGIYDDDPEITTLSRSDFERSVLDSSDLWFVNFYSPQCSHCHDLAPAWRQLARELQGVIQIGAVNCEEDWMLCRQQNIYSYPSLVLYPEKRKYQGSREAEDMINYILKMLPNNVISLTESNYIDKVNQEFESQPWLIIYCPGLSECVSSETVKKLGVILEHMVFVAEIIDDHLCGKIPCDFPITYYSSLNSDQLNSGDIKGAAINELETQEIVKKILHLLPEPQTISIQGFEEIQKQLKDAGSSTLPLLMQFTNDKKPPSNKDLDLKRLKSFLPEVQLGKFNCYNQESICSSLYILKYPTFVLFKNGGAYEIYHGHIAAYNVARFTREALSSRVYTITPENFPSMMDTKEFWFIDFFAPWCPPCMQFFPEWHKASSSSGDLVKFGTVDCSIHQTLCRSHNVNSYPSAILFKNGVSHKYHGSHSHQQINDFVEDILHPVVISLSPSTFEEVKNKDVNDVWVIDFFAPWCGPCQQLAPEWRKLAKMFVDHISINVAEVDCQAHQTFCHSLGINSYPTIRLFPLGNMAVNKFYSYSGWSRDALSLQSWIYNFLPSKVKKLSDAEFRGVLADNQPWVVYFYVSWCKGCQTFAPEFERVTQKLEGKIKFGKVNCEEFHKTCQIASVTQLPTVFFYEGKTGKTPQSPFGEEINTHTFNGVLSFIQRRLNLVLKNSAVRDEL